MRDFRFQAVRLAFPLLAIAACSTSRDDGGVKAGDGSQARAYVRPGAKAKDFFDDGKMYYVRIRHWDASRLSSASLANFQDSQGAVVDIFETDPAARRACPDDMTSDDKLWYRAEAFKLRAEAGMVKGASKNAYTIRFADGADRFLGMKELSLRAMNEDASQMREALALSFFRSAGIPAPGHSYAKLCVNGRYQGLYGVTEAVDEAFLARQLGAKQAGGRLYQGDNKPADIGPADLSLRSGKVYYKVANPSERTYALMQGEKEGSYGDLAALIALIHGENDTSGDREAYLRSAAFSQELEAIFNAKLFLRWAAMNMLVGGWDNYWVTPGHYYLYNARPDAKGGVYFLWLPWDYDRAFGVGAGQWRYADIVDWESSTKAAYGGARTANLPLVRQLLKNNAFLAYYLDAIEFYADKVLTAEAVSKLRSKLWAHIKDAAMLESDVPDCRNIGPSPCANTGRPFANHDVFLQGDAQAPLRREGYVAEGIEGFVRARVDNAKSQLAKWRQKYPKGASKADFSKAEVGVK